MTTWLPSSSIVLQVHPIGNWNAANGCILVCVFEWVLRNSQVCTNPPTFCNCNVSNVLMEQYERHKSAPPPSLCCYRDKAPGQRECDHSIDSINKCIRDIEQASLAAVGQSLPCRDDISLEVLKCISLYVSCLLVFVST